VDAYGAGDPSTLRFVDYERAESELTDFIECALECQALPLFSDERQNAVKALNSRTVRINRILASLSPDHGSVRSGRLGPHKNTVPLIERALELLRAVRRMEAASTSDGTPVFPMDVLDPLVSDAARRLWQSGLYRVAVSDAATNVNRVTQHRLGRSDVSDQKLMGEAFTDKEPKLGEPRLRCPGNPKSLTVQSQQQGAMYFAMGCFAAIRNPAHHATGGWNPVTAFHQLAALSMVAQWVQYWDIVYAPKPNPEQPVVASQQHEAPASVLDPPP
jgi:hypothetical protein